MKFRNTITGELIKAAPWQLALKAGDYYCIDAPTVMMQNETGDFDHFPAPTVYGEIITSQAEEDEPPYRPGRFLVRGFSQWSPEGELGEFCIVDATRQLTQAEFEEARASGWPNLNAALEHKMGNICPYCGSDNVEDIIDYLATGGGDMFRCLDCQNTWESNPPGAPAEAKNIELYAFVCLGINGAPPRMHGLHLTGDHTDSPKPLPDKTAGGLKKARYVYWALSIMPSADLPAVLIHVYYEGSMPDDPERDVINNAIQQVAGQALSNNLPFSSKGRGV